MPSRPLPALLLALALVGLAAASARAAEDAGAQTPAFKPGDVITYDQLDKLKPFLPDEFWDNRDFFFYEGMKLEIGAPGEYGPPPEFIAASQKTWAQAKLGPDNSLENYLAGIPFDPSKLDCKGDPSAAAKWMWNFDHQWNGDGARSSYFYSYWDRGEQLPLYYEGSAKTIELSGRVEKEFLEQGGDLFRGEKRKNAFGVQVDAPFDARGIMLMSYRYKSSEMPRAQAKNDDTWVYLPALRRVRRISTAQRTDAVSGTDFTFDDLRSFAGIVPQYEWQCLGERKILGPFNTKVKAYPYEKDHNFGPYGLSFADDRWELRDVVVIRFIPKNTDHPYHHKDIYIDKQSLTALYSFAYDQKEELWKIIWHNKRWSDDTTLTGEWYPGWPGIERPMDHRYISDIIINVQTGTGNRIEFWDSDGLPMKSKGKIRRYIDVGRLTKGR